MLSRTANPAGPWALLTCLFLQFCLPGQHREAGAEERRFLAQRADQLADYAAKALKSGFPGVARPLLLEVIADYNRDHGQARDLLGFNRFGSSWAPRPGFEYPEGDNPNPAAGKKVRDGLARLQPKMAGAHKAEAQRLAAAGQPKRALFHWRKVSRFDASDEQARAALGYKAIGNAYGSVVEERLFERSKMMDALVEEELRKQYEVQVVDGAKVPAPLAGLELELRCVKSEHFVVWGDLEPEVLQRAAQNSERALAFCKKALTGHDRFSPKSVKVRTFVYLKEAKSLDDLLKANASAYSKEKLEFLLKNVSSTVIRGLRVMNATQEQSAYDAAVRFVVQPYSNLRSDAMVEGIGHAVVARFFRINLIFSVGLQKTGTVTKRARKLLLPDLDTWKELAEEAAFDPKGTKAEELPKLSAASFPEDGRIKAWSFCDYLLRRDPKLLLELDNCRRQKSSREVAKRFASVAKISLDELEREWRDFWTGATPVLSALRNKADALHAMSSGAGKFLAAFNKLRAKLGSDKRPLPAVRWSGAYSLACKQHAVYIKRHRPKGYLAHTQNPDVEDGSLTGLSFAGMSLISTRGTSPLRNWIHLPGYRDALLNPYLQMIGVYVDGSVAVMDVVRGIDAPQRSTWFVYPPSGVRGVPRSRPFKDTGFDFRRQLAALERKPGRSVGYPITLHGFRSSNTTGVQVECSAGGEKIEGITITAANNRHDGGPGMVTFYPFEALPSGVVQVRFLDSTGRQMGVTRFTTK